VTQRATSVLIDPIPRPTVGRSLRAVPDQEAPLAWMRRRNWGSSRSRSQAPIKFTLTAVTAMARPGNVASHHLA
jgi:hypothetical protein